MGNGEEPLDEPLPSTQVWVEVTLDPNGYDSRTPASVTGTAPRAVLGAGRFASALGWCARRTPPMIMRRTDGEQHHAAGEPDRERNEVVDLAADLDVGADGGRPSAFMTTIAQWPGSRFQVMVCVAAPAA